MEHLTRFQRRKKELVPRLVTVEHGSPLSTLSTLPTVSGRTTPPSSYLLPTTAAQSPRRPSPFRIFHRTSAKRARSASPASLPPSPTVVMAPDSAVDGLPTPFPTSPANHEDQYCQEGKAILPIPTIPGFLDLSEDDILERFQDLLWLERKRLLDSPKDASSEYKYARIKEPQCKGLDRYSNIQPWLNNRVKLQVPDGQLDYINASPVITIPSCRSTDADPDRTPEPERYIVMQGPKQETTGHVWRMVVEQLQSPAVVVMLTEMYEGVFEKCYPYFPQRPHDEPIEVKDQFGDGFRASVVCESCLDVLAGGGITLRNLSIRIYKPRSEENKGESIGATGIPDDAPSQSLPSALASHGDTQDREPDRRTPGGTDNKYHDATGYMVHSWSPYTSESPPPPPARHRPPMHDEQYEERTVWHLTYSKWPDFGVPHLDDLESFLKLMRVSREKNSGPSNPRIVHCSAGVGRSGTFIAMEHLIRELDDGVLERWDERGDRSTKSSATSSSTRCRSRPTKLHGDDLIFTTVNNLREQRRFMVQSDSQYMYLYKVLRKLWLDKYGEEEVCEPAAKRLEVDPFVER